MSFEQPDMTKTDKKIKKESSVRTGEKSRKSAVFEETQASPGPEATADTLFHKKRGASPEVPHVSVPVKPKTEKEEFLERLSMYDEEEPEREMQELREDISSGGKRKTPFLEHKISEEAAQDRILENLAIALKESRSAQDIDRDDLEKILKNPEGLPTRIKTILNLAKADKIDDINTREKIFNIIYKALKDRESREVRKAFEEIGEMEGITSAEKKKRIAEAMNKIKEKYGIEEIFEYMRLGEKEGGTVELE